MGNTLLEMKGITKRFPGVVALNNVSMKINSGEVLAVVGENGAGKSTLIKIMSGAYQQDEGQVLFEGQDQGKLVPARALELGITAIYQELTNVKGLSIAENIFLGAQPLKNGLIDYKRRACEDHRQLVPRRAALHQHIRRAVNTARAAVHCRAAACRDRPRLLEGTEGHNNGRAYIRLESGGNGQAYDHNPQAARRGQGRYIYFAQAGRGVCDSRPRTGTQKRRERVRGAGGGHR